MVNFYEETNEFYISAAMDDSNGVIDDSGNGNLDEQESVSDAHEQVDEPNSVASSLLYGDKIPRCFALSMVLLVVAQHVPVLWRKLKP